MNFLYSTVTRFGGFILILSLIHSVNVTCGNDLIRFRISDTIRIDDSKKPTILEIPLLLNPAITFKDVVLKYNRPSYISHNNYSDKSFVDAFKITKSEGDIPCITVEVNVGSLRKHGTYKGEIVFSVNQVDIPVPFTIIKPAVALTFIDTVRVEIVAGKLKLNPLLIKETGLQAGIDSLIIAVPYFKKANTSATLTVTNPHRIPAGSVIGVTYDVPDEFKKDLPLGVTVGSFELFSPEMKEQLVVPIKIVKKRGGFCLLFCLFSGLLLGWVVRHYLQNKKDSEESKLSALALLEKMTQEKDRVKDGKFRTEVAKLINDLDTKLQKHTFFADMLKSTNTLENEMNSTLQQFEACKSDFEQRIAGAKKEWMEISSCFESVGYAPFIKEKLAEAENDYHSAKANLEEGDSENAKANIKNATNRMKGFLSEFAGKLDGLVLAIEEYDVYPQINPDPIKDSISPAMQGIKADLTQLLTVETPVSIGVALADKIKRNFDNILQLIKRRLTKRFYELEIESGGSGSWQSFYQSFEAWKQSIDGILRDPYREMDSNVLVTLAKHWSVFEQEPKVALLDGTMTGVDMEVLTVYEHDPLPVGIQFTGQIPGIAPVSVRLHQARKHWLVYSLVQTFLLWFVLALIAFKFYAPDFIGKTDELIVIFLFAFGVDITVDNVMQLRDKIKFP